MRAAGSPGGISASNASSVVATTTPLRPLLTANATSEAGNYVVTVNWAAPPPVTPYVKCGIDPRHVGVRYHHPRPVTGGTHSWSTCERWKGSQSMPAGRADNPSSTCSSPARTRRFLRSDTPLGRCDDTSRSWSTWPATPRRATQPGGAYGGWGQMLPEYFGPPVPIANYANSGAASGDFGFGATSRRAGNRRLDHHPVWTQRQDGYGR